MSISTSGTRIHDPAAGAAARSAASSRVDRLRAGPARRPAGDTTTGGIRSWRRSAGLREAALALVLYAAYSFTRTLSDASFHEAAGTAHQILAIERSLGLDVELAVNTWLTGVPGLAVIACYFYALLHYLVTPAVLVWLFTRHRERYRPARTALVVGSGLALVGFAVLPTAPPRLMDGYTDVLAAYSGWGWWGGAASAPDGLAWMTNQLAAMPSLHVGWAAWCGAVGFRYASRPTVRAAALAYPLLTAVVVVATGNHYVLDVVAGVLVIAAPVALHAVATRTILRRASRDTTRRRGSPCMRRQAVANPTSASTPGSGPARDVGVSVTARNDLTRARRRDAPAGSGRPPAVRWSCAHPLHRPGGPRRAR